MFFGLTQTWQLPHRTCEGRLPALLALSPLLLTRKIVQLVLNSGFSLGIPDERYLSVAANGALELLAFRNGRARAF